MRKSMNKQDRQVMNEWLAQIGLENSDSENTERKYRLLRSSVVDY